MNGLLKRLLVATDGSTTGDRAVTFAIALTRRYGSDLTICMAVDQAGAIADGSAADGAFALSMPLLRELDDAAKSLLADAARRAHVAGIVAKTEVLDGQPARAIVRYADDGRFDAIVIGSTGKRGLELLLGSTAASVLRRADMPTFVVPAGTGDVTATLDRMLVAIDDSDPSEAAADFALDLAMGSATKLVYCSILETRDLRDKSIMYGYDPTTMLGEIRAEATALLVTQVERARNAGVACERVVDEGEPARGLLEAADAADANAIVVGTHGRRGLRRLFVGSIAEGVVRRSHVPVVVVRGSRARFWKSNDRVAVVADVR